MMIEYKYKKVEGYEQKKFIEDGHTMFEFDVLQRLKRLAHLEEQIKQGQLLPIDGVSGSYSKEEIEAIKLDAHNGLPDDCVKGWDEVKFCEVRNGDGGECKRCSNYR